MCNVSWDREAGFEAASAFLADHVGDDLGGVGVRGVFVSEDQFPRAVLPLVSREAFAQVTYVPREHLDVDSLFGSVDGQGADPQPGHRGDVTRSTALGFDDEDPPAGRGGGLLDGVAVADQCIQAGVAADGVFGPGHVVADGGGEEHHGDAEGRVIRSGLSQFAQCGEGFEAADDEQGVELVEAEAVSRFAHADSRG